MFRIAILLCLCLSPLGVQMELDDCAFPLLKKVVTTDSMEKVSR